MNEDILLGKLVCLAEEIISEKGDEERILELYEDIHKATRHIEHDCKNSGYDTKSILDKIKNPNINELISAMGLSFGFCKYSNCFHVIRYGNVCSLREILRKYHGDDLIKSS